jgi:uncharacterized protein (TIGR00369 family)
MGARRLESCWKLPILRGMTQPIFKGPSLQPMDPEFVARVQESFSRQGMMRNLGARLGELKPGAAEIRVAYRDDLTQQHGYFHGGVSATIADTACGYAAYTLTAKDATVLTAEFKINMLAPAQGEELVARAHVVRSGRTLTVCTADVFGVRGGAETHCAHMVATIMTLAGKSDR